MTVIQRFLLVGFGISIVTFIHAVSPSTFNQSYLNSSLFTPAASAVFADDEQGSDNSLFSVSTETTNIENQVVANIYYRDPYQELGAGSFFMQGDEEREQGVFLKSQEVNTDVDIKVTGMLARTTLTQTFINNSAFVRDGLYAFPLPEDAAVDHLMLTVGDRQIEGQIKRKEQAKAIFKQAKKEGKKASLVAQHRPNIFTNEVTNIGPNETVVVTIEYQQSLKYRNSEYSLRFPMAIKPRYHTNSGVEFVPGLSNIENITPSSSYKNDTPISLTVSLDLGTTLQNIQSENHEIQTETPYGRANHSVSENNTAYEVTLVRQNDSDDPKALPKDFVLRWTPELGSQPKTSHFTQIIDGNEYGLVMIYPPVNDQTVSSSEGDRDREVTFVLDTSGSMAGDAIKQAKQALAFAIDDLASSDKFNIIQFNSSAEQLWHKAQYADQQNKMEAFGFISDLEASGGTEMYSALSIALKAENSNKGFFKQVLFITDGSVSNEHALMQLIGKELGNQRLFTIGIGAAPNSYFMTEAALVGKGSFTFIADTSQVNDKMRELLGKIKSPALTDIQLNLKSLGPTDKFEMYPNKIGDLYKHEPLAFSYKKTKGDSGQLTSQPSNSAPMLVGNYQGEQWQFTPTAFDESVDHKANSEHKVKGKRARGVNVLWAREKIAQLTRDKRMLTKSPLNNDVEAEEMIEIMTSTALEHHIVSAYTSLIAVDIIPTVKPNEKDPTKNANKVANTNSNKQGMLPQTATRADLTIIIGIVLLLIAFALRYQLAKKRGQRALEVACCYGIAE